LFSPYVQLRLDRLRHQLAHLDALPQLTLLGFLCGLAAALVIIAFRSLVELPLEHFLGGNSEGFESLPSYARFLLPVTGAAIIALLMRTLSKSQRHVSVGHVIERLHNHQGRLPLLNLGVQFLAGAIALLSGQSVGREGPAVHLGAGTASQLGQWLKLPHNSLRTLIGCGVAAAISASFNTPMAGVIFAMEVILMEYSIAGFVPVILASVTGAAVAQATFGSAPAFSVAPLQMSSLGELPLIIFCGLIIALFAACFIRLQLNFQQFKHLSSTYKLLLVGLLTGLISIFLPQVMGVGYDTIEATMQGSLGLSLLLTIAFAKLFLSTLSVGLGMPGGLIGPMLFIGACLGGALGLIAEAIFPEAGANTSFYALLGMGAMMAAVLNAPLAALITVLELSYNPNIIFPSMVMIVTSVVATRQVFGCDGVFIEQLRSAGFNLHSGPINRTLERIGVRSVMDINFATCNRRLSRASLQQLLCNHPQWLVVEENNKDKLLLLAADAATALQNPDLSENEDIDLVEIPARRWQLQAIDQQASLLDAQRLIQEQQTEAFFVERHRPSQKRLALSPVAGILMPEHIQEAYQ